jgi:hypothetical protein
MWLVQLIPVAFPSASVGVKIKKKQKNEAEGELKFCNK